MIKRKKIKKMYNKSVWNFKSKRVSPNPIKLEKSRLFLVSLYVYVQDEHSCIGLLETTAQDMETLVVTIHLLVYFGTTMSSLE